MPRAPARIEWSPDGTRFVSRMPDHRIRMHTEDGSVLRGLGRALDARWATRDQVMSICDRSTVRWHGPRGVDHQLHRWNGFAPEAAWFAPGSAAVALVGPGGLGVFGVGTNERSWSLDPKKHGLPTFAHLTVALSWGGERVAIGFTSEGRVSGRGFAVIDVARDVVVERDFVALDGLVDAPIGFAFDRGGTRFVTTHPERFPALGVIQLGLGDDRIRAHAGGARAVALDERGMIAAYAYARAPEGTAGRLQFDFLVPEARGGNVELESTLVFDPDLPDVIAVGFDPHSRWLACLASTGAIEIVPVP